MAEEVSDAILEERLMKACEVGDVDTVRRLVPDKVDVNTQRDLFCHMTPLHVACQYNQLSVVEALLELKPEVSRQDSAGMTPLHIACQFRNLDLVRVLMAHGADVNVVDMQGRVALHIACCMGGHSILKALSADGSPDSAPLVNVNRRDQFGMTALHYAVGNGNVDSAKLLLSRGADVNDKLEQKTLIKYACASRKWNMEKYLLERYPGQKD